MSSRIVRIALIAPLALLIVAALLVMLLDFGRFKGQIEAFVSDALSRQFAISGPLHVRLGRAIEIEASEIHLAAPEWSADAGLLDVGRLEASIDTWSLFGGPVEITRLVVADARVNLEVDSAGERNWSLPTPGATEQTLPPEPPLARLPAMLDNVQASNVHISYRSPAIAQPAMLIVDRLAEGLQGDRLVLSADGRLNDTPFALSAVAGTVAELLELGAVEAQLEGNVGEINLQADIAVADLVDPGRPVMSVQLDGPDVDYLLRVLGAQQFTSGPLRLEGSIAPGDRGMQLEVAGIFGEFELSADGSFVNLRTLDDAEIRFTAAGPDTSRVARFFGIEDVPDEPFAIRGAISRSGTSMIVDDMIVDVGDTTFQLDADLLDFPSAGGATINLAFEGPDFARFNRLLRLPGRLGGAFSMTVAVAPAASGGAEIELRAATGDIAYAISGILSGDPGLAGSRLGIEFKGPNLRVIAEALDITGMPQRAFSGDVSVERLADGFRLRDGKLAIDSDALQFGGVLSDDILSAGSRIDFELLAPDLEGTLTAFGLGHGLVTADRFTARGNVSGDGSGLLFDAVQASYAGVDAGFDGRLALPDVFDDSVVRFRFAGDGLSRWLPTNDAFRAPDDPFELDGTLSLGSGLIDVSGLQFVTGPSRLLADISLDQGLTHASATVKATSPNLNELSPRLAENIDMAALPLQLDASFTWRDNLLGIEQLHAAIGRGTLDVRGVVQGPPDFDDTNLQVELDVVDLSNLSAALGRELPDQPARLTATFKGDGDRVRLEEFAATVGESDLRGDFEYRSGPTPHVMLALESNKLDLTPYLPPVETADLDTSGGVPPGPAGAPDDRLIPGDPLQFGYLAVTDADIRLEIGELLARQHRYLDAGLEGTVVDGALTVEAIRWRNTDDGYFNGRLIVEPEEQGFRVGGRFTGDELKLGLPAASPEEYAALPSYDLNLAFIATGRNPRELAASLNGYLKLTSEDGRFRTGAMRMFTNDFLVQLLNTVNPFARNDPYSQLKCAVVLATVEQGKVSGLPALVLQSDRLKIHVNANIDLATERVDADFNTVPMKGLGVSLSNLVNPYVKVRGTLANPTLGLNAESTLIEGGAAVATGGITILAKGLRDRFFSDRDPCGTAVADADEKFRALEEKYASGARPRD